MDQNSELRETLRKLYANREFIFVPGGIGSIPYENGIVKPVLNSEILQDDDFYPVGKNKFGIEHMGLMKLSLCAGMEWETESRNIGRVDNFSNPDFCQFRMVSNTRQVDARMIQSIGTKHINLAEEKEAAKIKAHDSYYFRKDNAGKTIKGWKVKPPRPDDLEKFVEMESTRSILQTRRFIDEACESGAQNRAIRKALGIKPLPGKDGKCHMSGKKFYFVKYILDYLREDVLNKQLEQLGRSQEQIYGIPAPTTPSLPQLKDVTPQGEATTPEPEKEIILEREEDNQSIDFENLSFGEKIKTIKQFSEFSNYGYLKDDIIKYGEMKDWTDKQLVEYFKFLKEEDRKQ